VKVGTSKKNKV